MADAPKKDVYQYPGTAMDVSWDGRLCMHVGECSRAKGQLFVSGRDPWCQPDLTTPDAMAEVVRRCPSGALTATRKDGGPAETADPRNVVVVSNNGPLYARGDLRVDGAAPDMPGVRFRAALCRCGQSAEKPFCDNSHERAGFKDHGAVGETGAAPGQEGGPLEIRRAPNGPLLLSGNFTVSAASGRAAWHGTKAALCRCGGSANKPFCDGTHKTNGFKAE